MTKKKTNTHFLTKLLHPHQKFHVFYTVHIHPQAIHYVLILHPLENERISNLVSKKRSISPLKSQYARFYRVGARKSISPCH